MVPMGLGVRAEERSKANEGSQVRSMNGSLHDKNSKFEYVVKSTRGLMKLVNPVGSTDL